MKTMTMKNKIMNSKGSITLFLSLILVLTISFLGATNAYAHHIDYVDQIVIVFDEHERIFAEVEKDNAKLSDLQKEFENTDSNSAEFIELETQIDNIQTTIRAKENRMSALFDEIESLEKLNIESYKVDPVTEKKIIRSSQLLQVKYVDDT